ncbi:hypothetical protein, partial [Geobacillus stearothermophilus]|uniref:hypothetical protein n=2 Tax=Geobacillus stearothermophilus TaxID=1422 RepID=UPI0039F011D0
IATYIIHEIFQLYYSSVMNLYFSDHESALLFRQGAFFSVKPLVKVIVGEQTVCLQKNDENIDNDNFYQLKYGV